MTIRSDYATFLAAKTQDGADSGFEPLWLPDYLFDFQAFGAEWAIRKGRGGLFWDCGMGKTIVYLVWAENVYRKTGRRVLILTPLAVTWQVLAEAQRFGIDASRSRDGELSAPIVVTNYERLHHFTAADFAGVVCDESAILKSFDGERRNQITAFMRKVPYRLLATATAAPNDYIELGTSSEALGYLGHMDMLNRFFKNDQNNSATGRQWGGQAKWRFKGHAELPFWRWVCSWARAARKPSDLGFDDARFVLPPLTQEEHLVEAKRLREGCLYATAAVTLQEQREERRRTIDERCERAADLVNDTGNPAMTWCDLNAEGDLLEALIPDAIQISGTDSDDAKEDKWAEFIEGRARVMVTKPVVGAWGLNLQHCAHATTFPSHSYERFYQCIRRFWRFGQSSPVKMDMITTDGERGVLANLQRKSAQADVMFDRLVASVNDALHLSSPNRMVNPQELPSWL